MAVRPDVERDEATGSSSPPEAPYVKFRGRALLASLLLLFPVTYATANQGTSGIFSLMVAPVSALILVLLLNIVLRAISSRLAFNQKDLVTIWALVSVGGAVGGEWVGFNHATTYSYYFHGTWNATFKDQLAKYVPSWLAVTEKGQVEDILGGGRDMGYVLGRIPTYGVTWLGWFGLFGSLFFGFLCINSLMRGAWTERERLTYPLIQLPVAMAENGGSGGIWKSRYLWIAFAVMFGIDMLNGFNYLNPAVPSVNVKTLFQIDQAFREPPLSNIGDFRISIYPFMAALGVFIPSDLLLSFVVFFLLRKLTHVMLAANGIPQSTFSGTAISPGPPYFDEQTWGGVIALFLGALWVSREYLKEVWRDVRTGARAGDGGVKHRWAFVGLGLSFAVMMWYGLYGGLPWGYLVPYLLLFLVFSVVLTRLRAQFGTPTHEFAFFGSSSIMHRFLGTKWISDGQAAYVSAVFLVMNRIHRNHVMPYQLEAIKMTRDERLDQKRVFLAICLVTVVAFFLAMFFNMVRVYRTGGIAWSDAAPYLENILRDRRGPDVLGIVMTVVGFVIVMVLDAIRFRFPGFPLHPGGYVLCMNYGVDYYWFGMLVALLIKNFVQKYYGLGGYEKLRQAAFGILLGEYAAETIWMGMALLTNQSTYTISFNDRSFGAQ